MGMNDPETGAVRASLVPRNVVVAGRRTSVRLEPVMWQALREIAARERCSVNDLVTGIDRRRADSGLTAAIRAYIVAYYRDVVRRLDS
jgi:predicted DNA-binding ribbon-helix-helix protein